MPDINPNLVVTLVAIVAGALFNRYDLMKMSSNLRDDISKLRDEMNTRFREVNARFDTVDAVAPREGRVD